MFNVFHSDRNQSTAAGVTRTVAITVCRQDLREGHYIQSSAAHGAIVKIAAIFVANPAVIGGQIQPCDVLVVGVGYGYSHTDQYGCFVYRPTPGRVQMCLADFRSIVVMHGDLNGDFYKVCDES